MQCIGRVGFASSLFSGEAPKLLSVIITTVNIARYPKATGGSTSTPTSNRAPSSGTRTRKKRTAPAFVSNLVQVRLFVTFKKCYTD